MNYLKEEFYDYKKGREGGKSFEEIHPLKSHAFRSLRNQITKEIPPNSRILEIGFGSGYFLSLLAEQEYIVHGIDNTSFTVDYANMVFSEKGVNGRLTIGDGFNLRYPSDSFDVVINVGTIEHFPEDEQKKFLKEMKRVSKNLLLVSAPNDSPESLYQYFKRKSETYRKEEENILDLSDICFEVGCKPFLESGFHIISRKKTCPPKLKKLYEDKGLNLPKDDYTSRDLDYLIEAESKFNNQELKENAFLKYVLCKK